MGINVQFHGCGHQGGKLGDLLKVTHLESIRAAGSV